MMRVVISLGTNLGDRKKNMTAMTGYISALLDPPLKMSNIMETKPVGVSGRQQWFYNLIVSGAFNESARSLFEKSCRDERKTGRVNKNTGNARTADVDILLIDDAIIQEPDFIVPHPQILNRRFCIEGIAAIEPDWVHPVVNKSFSELSAQCAARIKHQKINNILL